MADDAVAYLQVALVWNTMTMDLGLLKQPTLRLTSGIEKLFQDWRIKDEKTYFEKELMDSNYQKSKPKYGAIWAKRHHNDTIK